MRFFARIPFLTVLAMNLAMMAWVCSEKISGQLKVEDAVQASDVVGGDLIADGSARPIRTSGVR